MPVYYYPSIIFIADGISWNPCSLSQSAASSLLPFLSPPLSSHHLNVDFQVLASSQQWVYTWDKLFKQVSCLVFWGCTPFITGIGSYHSDEAQRWPSQAEITASACMHIKPQLWWKHQKVYALKKRKEQIYLLGVALFNRYEVDHLWLAD